MDLREYTRGMVKLAKGMPWVSSAYRAGEKALDALTWLVTSKAHVSPKSLKGVAKEVLSKGGKKLSTAEKALLTAVRKGEQVPNAVKAVKGLARKHNVRELSLIKPVLLGAPAVGVYRGVKKSQKPKPIRYYGQRKSPHVFQHPAERLI